MKYFPKISIVTPCYNAGEFIEEAISSVLDQDYPNLQYVIIDGGSQDRTVDIIRKYEPYLTFWVSEPDEGQADAIAKGLAQCDGDVFNWLNADDYYLPGAFNIVSNAFANPSCNVLAGRSEIIGLGNVRISTGTDLYLTVEKTIGRARIDQPETFFRLSMLKALDGIDKTFHYLMDKELWIRYLLRYGLCGIQPTEAVLAAFRLHPNSKTVSSQPGFQSEQYRLERALFEHGTNQQDCQMLITEIRNAAHSVNLDIVRYEYALCQYEMAYARRDWKRMTAWRRKVIKSPLTLAIKSLPTTIQLEARKKLVQLSNAFNAWLS